MTKLTIVSTTSGTYRGAPITTYHLIQLQRGTGMTPQPAIVSAQCNNQEHARRLTACWNACDGTSTDWLEANQLIVLLGEPVSERVKAIQLQRDELLAILTRIVEWNERPMESGQPTDPGITQIQLAQAREAIAACKPE